MAESQINFVGAGTWEERLQTIVEMMREMSLQTDPQAMVRAYAKRMENLLAVDRRISISRRDLDAPQYRITRYSGWRNEVNPWTEKEQLPVLEGGILGELLYRDEPQIIDDWQVNENDPAYEYLEGQRSLMALPMYDRGVAVNMVVLTRESSYAFEREQFPEQVWLASLFGRATHNLVLAGQVREAYEMVDRELKVVADIQRSLLPAELPQIPTMKLAAHYETSRRAGGDYYDFFALADGKWGILIADVSGHGTPAAVMMAVTHSIAHLYPGEVSQPSEFLQFVNQHLFSRYVSDFGTFVTAFFGVYDPATRELKYASAGHNPPRLKRCAGGEILSLDKVRNLPLGVRSEHKYDDAREQLTQGDQIVLYTDGITEAHNKAGEMFGIKRLDEVLSRCRHEASEIIDSVLAAVSEFTSAEPATDDRTIVVSKIS